MKSASAYLYVNNVLETVEYYQKIFGGEIVILNKQADKVMHAELHLGTSLIHFSDTFGKYPTSISVNMILQMDSEEELKRIYEALLSDHGIVKVELQKTFFGALHAQITDSKNHINWVLNYFMKQPS